MSNQPGFYLQCLNIYIMELSVYLISTAVLFLDLALIAYLVLLLVKKRGKEIRFFKRVETFLASNSYKIAFFTSAIAMSGSLYFSNSPYWIDIGQGIELVERSNIWEPCRLCWFQRILMYPIVFMSATAIYLGKKDLKDYVMPLVLLGIPLSFYHAVIQRIEQFSSAGCSITQVSCQTQYTFHYGYITVPVMALTAFILIGLMLWRYD